jgi:hypothetical protein
MFKSKNRSVVIPQSEHLKLVGALAHAWGNNDFALPPIEWISFVLGVGLHDRGYGYLDTATVLEMPEEEWIEITRRGFHMPCSDPIADLITRYHLLRLTRGHPSAAVQALHYEFEWEIRDQLHENGFSPTVFERIDRITDLCDSISFGFCFEQPMQGNVAIFPRSNSEIEIPVYYSIDQTHIHVTPWPFSADVMSGYLIGYQLEGYPARLDPVLLPYVISPGK